MLLLVFVNLVLIVQCIPLGAPSNGMANCSGNLFEDVCKFSCNPGYELNGSETRVCMYNGEWSGTTAMCEQGMPIAAFYIAI